MKKLLILSGKGGTGKTTTAAAFIEFSKAKAFADCDVEAPNLHLVENMAAQPEKSAYYGSQKALIDANKCVGCQECLKMCRFNAISYSGGKCTVDEYACEGCGLCTLVCKHSAASLKDDIAGSLSLYKEKNKVFSTAELKMGRGNSGKLVSEVKIRLQKAAANAELAIIDGSPGIGCPVIASISGCDMALIVTEPSLSGLSDLKRILKTALSFGIKAAVCVNKADVCNEQTKNIIEYCKNNDIAFVGCIPYDKAVSAAVNSQASVAKADCPASAALKEVYDKTITILKEVSGRH